MDQPILDLKMKDKILNSIIAAIAKQKHIEPNSISEGSSLSELEISSLDAITIVYDIEEEFDIEVPGDELENFNTVLDIVDCMCSLVENR